MPVVPSDKNQGFHKEKSRWSPKSGSITEMSDHNHVHEVQSICFNLIFGWLYLANGQQYPCIVLCILSLYRILVSYTIRSVCIVSLYCILVSYPLCTNTCFDRIVLLDISIRIRYIKYTTFLGYNWIRIWWIQLNTVRYLRTWVYIKDTKN